MDPSEKNFTRFRWICTVIGLIFSLVDIGSDLLLAVQYFREGHYVWFGLTLLFILIGSVCAQIFSYSWFKDDLEMEGVSRSCTPSLGFLHLLQMGFFTRYYDLLKKSFESAWISSSGSTNHKELFGMAADLSMLRLMETFLESVPQLLLQSYIILQQHQTSKLQCISMSVSFLTVSWCTVDYWRCLCRSLPNTDEKPCRCTLVYLFYKVLTISARVLSLTLLITLSAYNILALAFVWVVGTVWAHVVNTDFCTSRYLEELYRAVVGVILVFTFFNIKGKRTRVPMSVYYLISMLQNFSSAVLLFLFEPRSQIMDYFLPVTLFIVTANLAGLAFLVLYYSHLCSRRQQATDEVDGIHIPNLNVPSGESRMDRFLSL